MPHLITHTTQAGRNAIQAAGLASVDDFNSRAELVVADGFNSVLSEERLVAGMTVTVDGSFRSNSMPVDIHVTILAWTSQGRRVRQAELRLAIRLGLCAWLGLPPTTDMLQVHLNLVG